MKFLRTIALLTLGFYLSTFLVQPETAQALSAYLKSDVFEGQFSQPASEAPSLVTELTFDEEEVAALTSGRRRVITLAAVTFIITTALASYIYFSLYPAVDAWAGNNFWRHHVAFAAIQGLAAFASASLNELQLFFKTKEMKSHYSFFSASVFKRYLGFLGIAILFWVPAYSFIMINWAVPLFIQMLLSPVAVYFPGILTLEPLFDALFIEFVLSSLVLAPIDYFMMAFFVGGMSYGSIIKQYKKDLVQFNAFMMTYWLIANIIVFIFPDEVLRITIRTIAQLMFLWAISFILSDEKNIIYRGINKLLAFVGGLFTVSRIDVAFRYVYIQKLGEMYDKPWMGKWTLGAIAGFYALWLGRVLYLSGVPEIVLVGGATAVVISSILLATLSQPKQNSSDEPQFDPNFEEILENGGPHNWREELTLYIVSITEGDDQYQRLFSESGLSLSAFHEIFEKTKIENAEEAMIFFKKRFKTVHESITQSIKGPIIAYHPGIGGRVAGVSIKEYLAMSDFDVLIGSDVDVFTSLEEFKNSVLRDIGWLRDPFTGRLVKETLLIEILDTHHLAFQAQFIFEGRERTFQAYYTMNAKTSIPAPLKKGFHVLLATGYSYFILNDMEHETREELMSYLEPNNSVTYVSVIDEGKLWKDYFDSRFQVRSLSNVDKLAFQIHSNPASPNRNSLFFQAA